MGCQSSKGAQAPAQVVTPQTPSKTLLEGAETQKSGEPVPTTSTTEHRESQTPQASPTGGVPATSPTAEPANSPDSGGVSSTVQHSGAYASGVHSHGSSPGLLRTHRMLCTSKTDLDIMVVEFSSHDSTVGSVLGRNCKEMRWKVMYDRDASPIDIKVHVQEHKLHSNEVEIECNGQPIFHGAGAHAKAKMTEDFRYQWPFRGGIKGIGEINFFEFCPTHFSNVSGETWFPATITAQREDGCFEVSARETDADGFTTVVKYPAVHKESLREAATRKPLVVPEDCLTLEVPKQDPLRAVLSLANGELVTKHFGKPSPSLSAAKPEVTFQVSKDRSTVAVNVGHQVLSHIQSGEVRAKSSETDRLRHFWTVQAGPFAEHKIEIVKKHTIGKIVTLLVDGDILVEGTAPDLGCGNTEWQCKFRLIGERILDFEVYKTNAEGGTLDETGHVLERRKYAHECCVTIPNDWDFTSARFSIDGKPFAELPMEIPRYEEQNLTTAPLVLLHSYEITTPYKVDRNAPGNMMLLANKVIATANSGTHFAGGFFAQWCNCSSAVTDDEVKA